MVAPTEPKSDDWLETKTVLSLCTLGSWIFTRRVLGRVTSCKYQPLQTSVHVLDDFPHIQHMPIVTIRIPLIRSVQKPRWNFRKAKWTKFSKQLEHNPGAQWLLIIISRTEGLMCGINRRHMGITEWPVLSYRSGAFDQWWPLKWPKNDV